MTCIGHVAAGILSEERLDPGNLYYQYGLYTGHTQAVCRSFYVSYAPL